MVVLDECLRRHRLGALALDPLEPRRARIGGVFAALVELVLIRPLYSRHIEQVLVTVGLQLAFVALITGIWGPDAKPFLVPPWLHETTTIAGAHIPNDRWVEIGTAVVVLALLQLFLGRRATG